MTNDQREFLPSSNHIRRSRKLKTSVFFILLLSSFWNRTKCSHLTGFDVHPASTLIFNVFLTSAVKPQAKQQQNLTQQQYCSSRTTANAVSCLLFILVFQVETYRVTVFSLISVYYKIRNGCRQK